MWRHGKHLLAVFFLVGLALRAPGLFDNTFQADEALFAFFARLIAVWRDPLLQGQIVDKPPLLFYLQALFYPLFGAVEWAARLPSLVASLLLIPLVGVWTWQLYRDELSVALAAAFVTFSPLLIQFSPSAFIDPLMTALLIVSLYCVSRNRATSASMVTGITRRAGWQALFAGLFFGLSVASKYQAWLFLPLIAGLALINGWGWRQFRWWMAGFLPVVAAVLLWDVARTGTVSLPGAQWASYGGLRLAWSWELWPRFEAWGEQWGYLLHAPVLGFAALLALPPFLALVIYHQDRESAVDQLLVVFAAAYFLLHWLLAVPIWDRYLVPVAPVAGLVMARVLVRLVTFVRAAAPPRIQFWLSGWRVAVAMLLSLLVLQAPAVLEARSGSLPVGARPQADEGARVVASQLQDQAYGTVLYDHWYSWHWSYLLFDTGVYVSWFDSPDTLGRDLSVFGRSGQARFIVVPDAVSAEPAVRAVGESGFKLIPVPMTGNDEELSMSLFRIVPR